MPAVNHIEKGVKTFQAKLLMMMAENFLQLLHSRNSVILFRKNKKSGTFVTFLTNKLFFLLNKSIRDMITCSDRRYIGL